MVFLSIRRSAFVDFPPRALVASELQPAARPDPGGVGGLAPIAMDAVFVGPLIGAAIATGLSTLQARTSLLGKGLQSSAAFKSFQRIFLLASYAAMTADWLQGPYVYALYDSYGFSAHDIAILFVAGFGSSMLFGTFAGALADRLGRKRACQLYCVLYALACVTKHVKSYWVLMLGRVLGGIATSLLFSSFEVWLIC